MKFLYVIEYGIKNDTLFGSVWNWREYYRAHTFSNGNPSGSRITTLKFINEDEISMLLTGSSINFNLF